MLDYLKKQMGPSLTLVVGGAPLLFSMYLLYWLEKTEVWLPETLHRDKITIVVVLVGMALSFFLVSHFTKRNN